MKTFYVVYKDKRGTIGGEVIELKDITKVNEYTIKRGVLKALGVKNDYHLMEFENVTIISWQETEELTQTEIKKIEDLEEDDYDTYWSLMCGDFDEEIFGKGK